jgi:hypothetical protein
MYCPKCSAVLQEDPRGWLRCSSGKLELSVALSRQLRDTYGKVARGAVTQPVLTGRDLFCPGCAVPVTRATGVCPKCGVSLRPIMWSLMELHPHGDDTGRYF